MTEAEIIQAGRELKEMTQTPGYARLKAEIDDLMRNYNDKVMAYRGHGAAENALPFFLYRFQALEELVGWIDDEIKRGENLMREKIEEAKALKA